MSTTMTIRLDEDVKDRLEALAEATHRSKSFLACEAIASYLVTNEWQLAEIKAALEEAEAGDFVSTDELAALADKWSAGGR